MHLNYLSILLFVFIFLNHSEGSTFEEDVTLTLGQKEILDKFKLQMVDLMPHEYMKEDIYLIKWLKVKNFNIQEAKSMLLDNLKWRKEQKMDTIIEEDWSDFERDYKYWLEGRDKQGRPILYFDIGTQDIRKAVLTGRSKAYLRYTDKVLEEFCTLVRTLGKKYRNMTRGNVIIDLDGYSLITHSCLQCMPIIIGMLLSAQNHYPLCTDHSILINAPAIFEPLLSTVRSVLDTELRRSLLVFGRNKGLYRAALEKDFDFAQLPPSVGGTKIYQDMDY